jgi:hypothetical protein
MDPHEKQALANGTLKRLAPAIDMGEAKGGNMQRKRVPAGQPR